MTKNFKPTPSQKFYPHDKGKETVSLPSIPDYKVYNWGLFDKKSDQYTKIFHIGFTKHYDSTLIDSLIRKEFGKNLVYFKKFYLFAEGQFNEALTWAEIQLRVDKALGELD